MPTTIERLRPRARKVLKLTLQEAEKLDDSMIHSGHFLVALLQVDGSVSKTVLENLMLSPELVRDTIEKLIIFKAYSGSGYLRIISLAEELKQILRNAIDETKQRRDTYIGTEHLLLGLCRLDEHTLVMQVLKQLGISPQVIRQKTLETLSAS